MSFTLLKPFLLFILFCIGTALPLNVKVRVGRNPSHPSARCESAFRLYDFKLSLLIPNLLLACSKKRWRSGLPVLQLRKFRTLSGRLRPCSSSFFFIDRFKLFTVGVCRKSVKFEERESYVAWSDQERNVSKNGGDNVVESAGDSQDASLDCDGQKKFVMSKLEWWSSY